MTKEQFIEKWLIGYEDLEQKLEFEIEMSDDLQQVIAESKNQENPTKEREGK